MQDFSNKSALVTGAGSGIGRGIALAFARAGARVAVSDVDVAGGEETVRLIQEIGGEGHFYRCDVSRAVEVQALVAAVVKDAGALDFAVNNAAIGMETDELPLVPEAVFDRIMAVNVKGVFLCLQQEIRQMALQGKGAIVNIASVNSYRPQNRQTVYTASKHAVLGLTRNAAIDAASSGVRINAIAPGAIDTPMLEAALRNAPSGRDQIVDKMSLIGRLGLPEDVAKAALWLCSDEASFTYGHTLAVDGGYLVR
ncbi:glucose 1-dehydrogenase [Pseudomonas veronii]